MFRCWEDQKKLFKSSSSKRQKVFFNICKTTQKTTLFTNSLSKQQNISFKRNNTLIHNKSLSRLFFSRTSVGSQESSATSTSTLGSPDAVAVDNSLEIKDPSIIFNNVWTKLEKKYGIENLQFPKEIIWLMGAPGAGKSFNAPWILKARGITSSEIVISSLLTSPEAERIKREAGLVGDSLVVELLLEKLLQREFANGVLVDGFPRTKVQVECIKILKEKMLKLRSQFIDSKEGINFRRPSFRVAVLFVDEKESVERQLKRGKDIQEHNKRVRDTGSGEEKEERATDFSDELARRRYSIFKDHYSTLTELQKYFAFSVINTKATVSEVREKIYKEFMYQSSLELGEETYNNLQRIPLVSDITKHARQNLVRRLDNYQTRHTELWKGIIQLIQIDFIPILELHCLSGEALIESKDKLLSTQLGINIVLDVLSERGYVVSCHPIEEKLPIKFDKETGEIVCETVTKQTFKVRFRRSVIREDLDLMTAHH